MKAYKYRFLLWQLIAALDSGKCDSLSIADVYRHAYAGTSSAFLIDRFGPISECPMDLSIFDPPDWVALSEYWASLANAVDARRKFGVEKKGISLLMAYTLQSMRDAEEAGAP
jgi:hypothetical protein